MNPSLMTQLNNSMQSGGSPMDVQTPGSPMFDPSLQTPSPTPMPQGSPMSQIHVTHPDLHAVLQKQGISPGGGDPAMQPNAAGNVTLPLQDQEPQSPGVQVPLSDAQLIIKAMTKHMDHKNKIEAKVLDAALPQPEPSQVQPQI